MIRRHERASPDAEFHYEPAQRVVSGNFVSAVRRGVVGGVDHGATGAVRFVRAGAVAAQLDAGNVVLLSNVGYTPSGDPLNMSCYDVAAHAAAELSADKLVILTGADVASLGLPAWLPLDDAESLVERALGPGGGADRPGGGVQWSVDGGDATTDDTTPLLLLVLHSRPPPHHAVGAGLAPRSDSQHVGVRPPAVRPRCCGRRGEGGRQARPPRRFPCRWRPPAGALLPRRGGHHGLCRLL